MQKLHVALCGRHVEQLVVQRLLFCPPPPYPQPTTKILQQYHPESIDSNTDPRDWLPPLACSVINMANVPQLHVYIE